jgi:hypothetical protein
VVQFVDVPVAKSGRLAYAWRALAEGIQFERPSSVVFTSRPRLCVSYGWSGAVFNLVALGSLLLA